MELRDFVLGLAFSALILSLSSTVQAAMCCASLINVRGDSTGISGQLSVTNVAANIMIDYRWELQYTPSATLAWSSPNSGNAYGGRVESSSKGVFPFWCQLPSRKLGAGLYRCALTASVRGGSTFNTIYTSNFFNLAT